MTDRLEQFRQRRFRLPSSLDRMVSIAVTEDDTIETARTKRLAAGVLWVTLPISMVASFQLAFVQNAPTAGAIVMTGLGTTVFALFVMWRRPSTYPDILHPVLLNTTLTSMALTVMAGGLLASGVSSVWGFVTVLGTVVIFADWRATAWSAAVIATQIVAIAWAA
jgi:hypothetical protein